MKDKLMGLLKQNFSFGESVYLVVNEKVCEGRLKKISITPNSIMTEGIYRDAISKEWKEFLSPSLKLFSETVFKTEKEAELSIKRASLNDLQIETIELIERIYGKYPSGGALHIVLDDGNVMDRHILWCIRNAIHNKECCHTDDIELFEQCAVNLLKLGTEEERLFCIEEALRGE